MKYINILLMALAAVPTVGATTYRFTSEMPAPMGQDIPDKVQKFRAASALPIWRAGTVTTEEWNGTDWEHIETMKFVYDEQGRVIEDYSGDFEMGDEATIFRTVTKYSDGGLWNEKLTSASYNGGETYTETTKKVRMFDTLMPSVVVENHVYIQGRLGWEEDGNSNNYRRVITRDENNNVLSSEVQVAYLGQYDGTIRTEMEYGADGRISTIKSYYRTYDENHELIWVQDGQYSNIEWERFDGQIASTDELLSGSCRLAKAEVKANKATYTQTVTYPDERGSYKASLAGTLDPDASGESCVMKLDITLNVLDANGSYDMTTNERYVYGNGYFETYVAKEGATIDEWGNLIESYITDQEGSRPETIISKQKGEIEYNATYGYPEVYTLSEYSASLGTWVYGMRELRSDYVDAAGVAPTVADTAEGPEEYYNLQGVRLSQRPESGFYIRRQGSSVEKIFVK